MAESYSVKAILSAQDRGFTSAFKSAMGTVSNLKSTLTSGIGFGIMAGIGQKAFGAVTSSIGGMVSELNSSSAAWKTFNGNMSMVGKGADEIASNVRSTDGSSFSTSVRGTPFFRACTS